MSSDSKPRATRKASRDKQVLEFWEHRAGRKLTNRDAAEMQANVEGVIALLAQWDREESAVTGRRKKHGTSSE